MSINADFNVPADNPFVDLSSLKDANLTEGEKTILSNCKYEELQKKWCANVNLIAQLNSKHLNRNVNANSNPVFPNAGPSNAKNLKEAGKQVFRDWGEFNKHIMYKIPREMYKKIAQTNPHYFDKVIEHLDTIADTLKKEGTQDWGSINADLFRITAGYLRRMMHGDGAAKPENNNANPGANREQPTIINHYHNNIQFGNNYNNYGHIGNNNFYNKGGNMAVMFKESSNGVPNTSFRPEYSVSKSEHSFYSPTINGIKVLDVTAENALKLLGQDKSEEKENDKVNVGFKTNKNEQNVEGYHTMRNLYSKVHVPKKSKETSETLLKTYHNLVKTTKPEDPHRKKTKN